MRSGLLVVERDVGSWEALVVAGLEAVKDNETLAREVNGVALPPAPGAGQPQTDLVGGPIPRGRWWLSLPSRSRR